MPIKATYLALLAGGGGLAFAGIKGYSPAQTFRDIISGKDPSHLQQANPIQMADYPPNSAISGYVVGPGASNVANLAIEYIGYRYVWGGAPNSGGTDCSGFVNMIVGWFARLPIPGYAAGAYQGQVHGPATLSWLAWNGSYRIPLASAQPGDLAVWQTHMGIIVDNGIHMVSDLNPSLGTLETTIKGAAPPGEILSVQRLKTAA